MGVSVSKLSQLLNLLNTLLSRMFGHKAWEIPRQIRYRNANCSI